MKRFSTILMLALAFAFAITASAASDTFTKTLKKGSSGAEVVALQTLLESKSLLTMPAGVAKGYFGALTVSAVKAYQASKGIATVGQVGPATRLALNAEGAVVSTGATATGTTATAATTGITTPGVEGILSVTSGPITTSVANIGQKMVPILAVRAQAQNSDIAIQRITLNLGTDTKVYNKVYSALYVMNGSTVLATIPLNSTTVVQNGSSYVVNATGFNVIVAKNTYKDITIAADLYGATSLTLPTTQTISVGLNGVRGVDGAGIVQYGPDNSINGSITINSSLTDNAQANVSTDPSSAQTNLVPVTDTTNGQYLGLPVLTFAVNAQNDTLHIRNLKVNFAVATSSVTPATARASVAYLYQGATMVQSASIVYTSGTSASATFSNIINGTAGASIPLNTTVPYTVKVDVSGVTAGTLAVTATLDTSSATTFLNSQDGSVADSTQGVNARVFGSAIRFTQTVAGNGPALALASAPTLTKVNTTARGATKTQMTYTAQYLLNVTAVGTDLHIGLAASGTAAAFGTASTSVRTYVGGIATTTDYSLAVNYSKPTGTTDETNGFIIARGQTIQVPVTYTFVVTNPGSSTFSLGLSGIKVNGTVQNFMDGLTNWRTNVI